MTEEKMVIYMISIFVDLSCSETNNLKTKQFFNATENELKFVAKCLFICLLLFLGGERGGGYLG
jgi:hypothetical protein